MRCNRVLMPTDGSPFSLKILPTIQQFLAPDQNELIFLTVAQHPIYQPQTKSAVEAKLKVTLLQWMTGLQAIGYTVSSEVRFGEPSEEITKFVDEEEIDCIALTTHSQRGLSRLLLGSVAEQLLRNVSIPLLLLRPLSN